MPKKRITIPKGTKDCQGTECNQNLEFEIDIPDNTITTTTIPSVGVSSATASQPQTILLQQPPPPDPVKEEKPKEDPHEMLKKALPRGVNFAKCEGEDCGHQRLKNPKQTTHHKSCPGCKNNSVPKNNNFCPNCGLDEDDKKFDEWEESEIEMELDEEDE